MRAFNAACAAGWISPSRRYPGNGTGSWGVGAIVLGARGVRFFVTLRAAFLGVFAVACFSFIFGVYGSELGRGGENA